MTTVTILRSVRGLSRALLPLGAALVLAGTLGAWAQVTLLHNILLSVPGVLFAAGAMCLSVAILTLLGARRFPLLCLVGAIVVLAQTHQAVQDVPHLVKHQIVGAQLALFPLNRLLDQFHIGDVQIGDWSVPNAHLLGAGLTWTMRGGWVLLAGALAGLPSDPALGWFAARTVRSRCRACDARWLASRPVRFCPRCGSLADTQQPPLCPHCSREAMPGDVHCIACGTALDAEAKCPSLPQ